MVENTRQAVAEPAPAPGADAVNALGLTGYTARPLTTGDAHAVFELMAEGDVEALGQVVIEEADIVGDWQRPSFDIARHSIGVYDGERLVGYAEVYQGRWAEAAVALRHRGHGIGTALARWTQRLSCRDGKGLVGMPVPEGSAGERLLQALGYEVLWTSWVLEMPSGKDIEPQPVGEGYSIRAADGDADHRAAHHVVDEAFLEWSDRDPESFEDFAAGSVLRPGFEPWHLRLMLDPSGAIVGVSLLITNDELGYVAKLAVHRDHRGRGLARALLVDSFAVAREHGTSRSELSTDSRTGALGLYEKVGMEVTSLWRHWAIDTSGQH